MGWLQIYLGKCTDSPARLGQKWNLLCFGWIANYANSNSTVVCFFDSCRSQTRPDRVSKPPSDKLRQLTYLALLKTLCYCDGMKIAIGRRARLSRTASQTSITLLSAWMWEATFLSHRTKVFLWGEVLPFSWNSAEKVWTDIHPLWPHLPTTEEISVPRTVCYPQFPLKHSISTSIPLGMT